MSQQALVLESLPPAHKDSDEHLEELIIKWRGAARQAADHLFGVAGDRVNRMGGARVYFERERDRKNKWEDEADSGVISGWADAEDGAEADPEVIEERKRQLMAEYDLEEPSPSSKSRKEVDIAQKDDDVSAAPNPPQLFMSLGVGAESVRVVCLAKTWLWGCGCRTSRVYEC